jgi:ribosome modulation factor
MPFLTDIEDTRRYSAPRELDNGSDEELSAYDQGFEDRICCYERDHNPYSQDADRLQWLCGWDSADQQWEESP